MLQLETQCTELNNDKYETKAENEKLRLTNKEMRRDLERTSQELLTAQRQLKILQEEASQLHEEREMYIHHIIIIVINKVIRFNSLNEIVYNKSFWFKGSCKGNIKCFCLYWFHYIMDLNTNTIEQILFCQVKNVIIWHINMSFLFFQPDSGTVCPFFACLPG